jgi:hypothetical protein
MPIILAIQEAEIKRIVVERQPRQIVHETLSEENPLQKRAGGVAQGEGPEFKDFPGIMPNLSEVLSKCGSLYMFPDFYVRTRQFFL